MQRGDLSLSWSQVPELGQTLDDKVILAADVLLKAGQFGIDDGFGFELMAQTSMVLLQSNHAVLEDPGGLGGLAVEGSLMQRS